MIVGTGNFDGVGGDDILWRHEQTGQVYIWLLDGTQVIGAGSPGQTNPQDWSIVGTGDFGGTNSDDILWRNNQSGLTYIWFIGGTQFVGGGPVGSVDPKDWTLVGTGDFDGIGTDDILWRNNQTGKVLGAGRKGAGSRTRRRRYRRVPRRNR